LLLFGFSSFNVVERARASCCVVSFFLLFFVILTTSTSLSLLLSLLQLNCNERVASLLLLLLLLVLLLLLLAFLENLLNFRRQLYGFLRFTCIFLCLMFYFQSHLFVLASLSLLLPFLFLSTLICLNCFLINYQRHFLFTVCQQIFIAFSFFIFLSFSSPVFLSFLASWF